MLEFSYGNDDKGMTMATKLCTICKFRAVGTGQGNDPQHARTMGYCAPCLEEAEWENVHSDDAHGTDYEGSNSTDDCWICHPELNVAIDRTPRRKGHTNTVAKSRASHAEHYHARTPADRAMCRKSIAAGNGPLDMRAKKN